MNHCRLFAMVTLGIGGIVFSQANAQVPAPEEVRLEFPPLTAAIGDSPLRKLMIERYNTAREEVFVLESLYQAGRIMFDPVATAQVHLSKSAVELAATPAERIKQRELALTAANRIEDLVKLRHGEGTSPRQEVLRAKGLSLDAEIELLREREAAKVK